MVEVLKTKRKRYSIHLKIGTKKKHKGKNLLWLIVANFQVIPENGQQQLPNG